MEYQTAVKKNELNLHVKEQGNGAPGLQDNGYL